MTYTIDQINELYQKLQLETADNSETRESYTSDSEVKIVKY